MRDFLLLIFLCLSLSNCASPKAPINPILTKKIGENSLYKITIYHQEETKFSGIIGLKIRTDGIYCVLLDATGLSLFSGVVKTDGSIMLINSLDEIKKRKLPDLIAAMLWAVYLAQADAPCPWYRLHCIEHEKSHQGQKNIISSSYFGFLQSWQAIITLKNELPDTIYYTLKLQRVTIEMKKMQE